MQFLKEVINENFTISFVTYIGVLDYKDVPLSTQDFIALADVIEIDKTIIGTCVDLRNHKKIKLPDTIIVATALVHGLTLLTRNTKDFQTISGLVCANPYEQ